MEYFIVGLLIILILFVIILIFQNKNSKVSENNISDRMKNLELNMIKEIGNFKSDFSHNINEDFTKLNDKMEEKIRLIHDRVNERLDVNFERTNKTFNNVLERLSKIDEAQKKIDVLSNDIVSLQGVLTDKKTRGIFGEVNLEHIMINVFGKNNDKIYKMQHTFPNGTIADCVLFTPEPLGTIAIDSKFPLEHYQIMVDKNYDAKTRQEAEKCFRMDMKKHIDAISSKYIIPGVTSEQAILFLPAEAIFAEINAYHNDIIEYSYKKHVWITSPTTLISTLTTIQVILKNIERDQYTQVIHQELLLLDTEFKRYRERWDKLYRSIETVSRDVKDVYTTTDKITKRFDSINQVEIKEIDYNEKDNTDH